MHHEGHEVHEGSDSNFLKLRPFVSFVVNNEFKLGNSIAQDAHNITHILQPITRHRGMPADDAKLVGVLVKGELRGYGGHGVNRVNPI